MQKVVDFPYTTTAAENALIRMTKDLQVLLTVPTAVLHESVLFDENGKRYSAFEIIEGIAHTLHMVGGDLDAHMHKQAHGGDDAA